MGGNKRSRSDFFCGAAVAEAEAAVAADPEIAESCSSTDETPGCHQVWSSNWSGMDAANRESNCCASPLDGVVGVAVAVVVNEP